MESLNLLKAGVCCFCLYCICKTVVVIVTTNESKISYLNVVWNTHTINTLYGVFLIQCFNIWPLKATGPEWRVTYILLIERELKFQCRENVKPTLFVISMEMKVNVLSVDGLVYRSSVANSFASRSLHITPIISWRRRLPAEKPQLRLSSHDNTYSEEMSLKLASSRSGFWISHGISL